MAWTELEQPISHIHFPFPYMKISIKLKAVAESFLRSSDVSCSMNYMEFLFATQKQFVNTIAQKPTVVVNRDSEESSLLTNMFFYWYMVNSD